MGSPYQSQSATGYNSSPPADDGSTVASNKITWAGIKTKLADSLKTLADAINTQIRAALNVTPISTSAAYTTLVGDHITTIETTSGASVHLGDAATMIAQTMGYTVTVYNKSTSSAATVDLASAANTLAGQTNGTVTLPPGAAMTFTVAASGVGYDIVSATGFAPFALTGAAGTNTATANAPANLIGLFNGLLVVWTPANTTTGATNLNITPSGGSALTAKSVFSDGAACVGGEAKANVPLLLQYDGTQFNIIGRRFFKQPSRQVFTSGVAQTYTTPAGCTRINVRMVGGGAGGAGATANNGTAGNATTFSGSSLSAAGGGAGLFGGGGQPAGGAGTNGDINITGGGGQGGTASSVANINPLGGQGGSSAFGGGGSGGAGGQAGQAGGLNSGAGGGGAGGSSTTSSGGGGGAGAYVEKLFTAPSATYTYTVGAAANGGAAGGAAGGNGAAGIIIVDEFYD